MCLIRGGSRIIRSDEFGERTDKTLDLDHIVELALCSSKFSLGLQVADFFATFAFQAFKQGKPKKCVWWEQLCSSLYRKKRRTKGIRVESFPLAQRGARRGAQRRNARSNYSNPM